MPKTAIVPVEIVNLPAQAASWLDPSALSQIVGALIGAVIGAIISVALWRYEGRRIRAQVDEDRIEQKRRTLRIISLDLYRMRKGISQIVIRTDELKINAGRGFASIFLNGNFKMERMRFISLFEAWLDTDAAWIHIEPSFVSQEIIEAIGNVVSARDEIFMEYQNLSLTVFRRAEEIERLSELQGQLNTLDGELRTAINLVNSELSNIASGG